MVEQLAVYPQRMVLAPSRNPEPQLFPDFARSFADGYPGVAFPRIAGCLGQYEPAAVLGRDSGVAAEVKVHPDRVGVERMAVNITADRRQKA